MAQARSLRDIAIGAAAGGRKFGQSRGVSSGTDLNTGERLWRTFQISPGAGEGPGQRGDPLEGRPGAMESNGRRLGVGDRTYDSRANTFYQGIGNAGPDLGYEYRPGGQNKKGRGGVLAANPHDGEIKWGDQLHAGNDPFDFGRKSPEQPDHQTPRSTAEDRKLVVHGEAATAFY